MTGDPLVSVVALRKEFPSGGTVVRAVDGVDFCSGRGEITLIMGPSGSGKTTLLTMIGALLEPTSGSVVIDGLDIAALDRRSLPAVRRQKIGFVFQTFNLLESLTAQENVEIVLNVAGVKGTEATQRARALLERVGLGHRLHFNARDLSGGEKQRVSIARALANRPPLLLADEPTANLDSAAGHDVMELLQGLAADQNTGVIVVSHDPRLAAAADTTLWMVDGRIFDHAPEAQATGGEPAV